VPPASYEHTGTGVFVTPSALSDVAFATHMLQLTLTYWTAGKDLVHAFNIFFRHCYTPYTFHVQDTYGLFKLYQAHTDGFDGGVL
jgi:hypothetical protein